MAKYKNKLFFIIFIVIALIPVLSLFHTGLTWTQDGQDQVARIANFYQNLIEGNFIPRWAANLNWGYGHPILEFLYPLPSYIASAFHVIGFSLVTSADIVYGLGMVLSLLFMYLWLSQFLDKMPSFLGAVLYTYAPYRFIDLYVRGDIGENLAFAFIPLVLYFVYKLYKKGDYKYSVFGGVSLALLILAHNAVSLEFVPFILFYCAYLVYISKERKQLIINYVSLVVLGFTVSAFFWIPGLLEGKYTLRNIVVKGGYLDRFVSFGQLIYGPWNYGQTGQFTVQLGIVNWLAFILSPVAAYAYFKKKNKNYILIVASAIYILAAIFLMLSISNFIWSKVMLLQDFQFPWRFLSITVFSTAFLGALILQVSPKKYRVWITAVLIVAILFFSKDYMRPKGYLYNPESFYAGVYPGTTDTGESAPIWSVRFMEHYPQKPIQIISGTGKVRELARKSVTRLFSFDSTQSARVLINTLYFPGWNVYVDKQTVPLQFQDPSYRGLMTFNVPSGSHQIEAIYSETRVREISDVISIIGIFFAAGFLLFRFVKK